MSDKLDHIIEKLSDISEKLGRMSGFVERNTADLSEHIKRTNLLEKKLDKTEKEWDDKVEEALLPVKWAKITIKVLGASAVIFTIFETVNAIIK